jgi:hypothetical protein
MALGLGPWHDEEREHSLVDKVGSVLIAELVRLVSLNSS